MMKIKEIFLREMETEFEGELKGAAFPFATRNEKYIEWLESKLNEPDFYTALMSLINMHCDNGLCKKDLVQKMEYATVSCILS